MSDEVDSTKGMEGKGAKYNGHAPSRGSMRRPNHVTQTVTFANNYLEVVVFSRLQTHTLRFARTWKTIELLDFHHRNFT